MTAESATVCFPAKETKMIQTQPQNNSWKRSFFTIAAGQTVSLIGSSAVQFSLIWWLASGTNSPLVLSLAGLLAFLPQMVLGPFVGVWVDRLKRKNVIIWADLFTGIIAAVFACLFFFGDPPFWSACLVLGMRAVGGVFHQPAIQAAIPMLVPSEELVRANGWSQFMQSGAFMLGPVLGAAMYAALPLPVILLSDLVGAVAAVSTVAAVKIPDPPKASHAQPHFLRELREGAAVLLANKRLCVITLAGILCMVFYTPLSTYYPLMSSSYFKASAWHAGIVELGYAAGMMLVAFLIGGAGLKRPFAAIHLGLLGLGLTSFFCGILPPDMRWFWVFAVLCALMGGSGNLYNIPFWSFLQQSIPNEAQGRVFSLIATSASFTMPLGLLLAGPVAQKYGVEDWFFIAGIACVVITAISALVLLRRKPA